MATTLKLVTGELVDITAKYPSNYWHTPTYSEMNYILNTRTNASNLLTLGRVEISSGVYRNGCFLLPDDWFLPTGVSMTITTANYTTNTYLLADFGSLENNGAIFFPAGGIRQGLSCTNLNGNSMFWLLHSPNPYTFNSRPGGILTYENGLRYSGFSIRLCIASSEEHSFSVSATEKIKFAKSNLQYHCTQHIWRFAEHSYDIIGADNANISDSYNGWIDLFGYGTSGVNFSPTLHTTNNADYAQGDLLGTVNDWGYNKICVDTNPLDTRTKIYENKVRALEFSNI